MSSQDPRFRLKLIVSFALLYTLWGSTYLAMRVAVQDMPAFVIGSVRYLTAGPLMLVACALMGRKVRLTRTDFRRLLGIGVLLLSIGNMGILWSEKYISSGLAALIAAVVPIWVVVIEAWILRSVRITLRIIAGLGTGILGLLVLLWPRLTSGTHLGRLELLGCTILFFAAFFWALGSIFSGRWSLTVDVFSSAAWQMTLGGAVNFLIALALGQFHHATITRSAVLSIAYLVVFGSWIGYSCFVWLLEHVPTTKVSTYTYVNPIVAVFLGWALLHERVDAFMLVGTVIIIGSVAVVNTSKIKRTDVKMEEEHLAPANVGGD
jgi:drug/metabolite transporter (DMT)-like permease